jgi:hypothetical protein
VKFFICSLSKANPHAYKTGLATLIQLSHEGAYNKTFLSLRASEFFLAVVDACPVIAGFRKASTNNPNWISSADPVVPRGGLTIKPFCRFAPVSFLICSLSNASSRRLQSWISYADPIVPQGAYNKTFLSLRASEFFYLFAYASKLARSQNWISSADPIVPRGGLQ